MNPFSKGNVLQSVVDAGVNLIHAVPRKSKSDTNVSNIEDLMYSLLPIIVNVHEQMHVQNFSE